MLVGWSDSSGAGNKPLVCINWRFAGQSLTRDLNLIDDAAFYIKLKEDKTYKPIYFGVMFAFI
jgi:hypothetical protein